MSISPHFGADSDQASDVPKCGFDTGRSADHDWGPRVIILVADAMPRPTRDETLRHLGGIDQYIVSTDGREWIGLHLAIRRWRAENET